MEGDIITDEKWDPCVPTQRNTRNLLFSVARLSKRQDDDEAAPWENRFVMSTTLSPQPPAVGFNNSTGDG